VRERILTALVLAAVMLGALFAAPPWATRAVFGLCIAAGAWEWALLAGARSRGQRLGYVLVVALVATALRVLLAEPAAFRALIEASVALWCLALLWLLAGRAVIPRLAVAVVGMAALVPTWVALTRMVELWPHGARWVLFVLVLSFGADTGAYFAGRAFGRVHLAPSISPGKTWEGVIGGLALALLLAWAGATWLGATPRQLLPVAICGAAFSVVGDLVESLCKRSAGLKDSGSLFPGHGGVLDRIDSVLAATPVTCLGLLWLGAGI
jgi:phosphatidate cytidylyltransferase